METQLDRIENMLKYLLEIKTSSGLSGTAQDKKDLTARVLSYNKKEVGSTL